jgi:hypothetical protein
MKKTSIVLATLLALSGFAFAAGNAASSATPWVDKGNLLVNVGLGWGGLSAGAEYDFARIDVAKVVPITFGGAARALIDPGVFDTTYSTFEIGLGAFVTAHVGFKELSLSSGLGWVSHFDLYLGLGLGFASGSLASAYSGTGFGLLPGVGISTFEGVSYYFNDRIALNLEYGYIGRIGYSENYGVLGTYSYYWPLYYSTIGVILKL